MKVIFIYYFEPGCFYAGTFEGEEEDGFPGLPSEASAP